jgi:DNA-binding transcriptional ArsR family regulator
MIGVMVEVRGTGGLADDDAVFRALADPTRRAVLDALFAADGQTLGELCAVAPQLSRYGVMKHLRVLEDAGLLTRVSAGRSTRHHLNPVPIAQIAERWIDKYAAPYAAALLDLRRQLDSPNPTSPSSPPRPQENL